MITEKDFNAICTKAGLIKLAISSVPTFVTEDKKEGAEYFAGTIKPFIVKDNERVRGTAPGELIQRVVTAGNMSAEPVAVKEQLPKELPIEVKAHNSRVIGSVSALAGQYGIPAELANMFFMKFDNQLYIKNPGLLWLAAKKGYAHMEVTCVWNEANKEWDSEYKIYPVLTKEMVEAIAKLDPSIQEKAMIIATKPCNGLGSAGDKTIKMKTMLLFARELAQTRAQNRALRAYTGYGGTSAEELE